MKTKWVPLGMYPRNVTTILILLFLSTIFLFFSCTNPVALNGDQGQVNASEATNSLVVERSLTPNPTRYGTAAQLRSSVAFLTSIGLESYFDVVFNHRMGASTLETVPLRSPLNVGGVNHSSVQAWTRFNLPGRQMHYTAARWGSLHHNFVWDWRAFNGTDWVVINGVGRGVSPVLFQGKLWPSTFGQSFLMGMDVDYWLRLNDQGAVDPNGTRWAIRDEMRAWGRWIIQDIGFAGFRMDATAHVDDGFIAEWVHNLQNVDFPNRHIFFVAEAWVGDVPAYLNAVDNARFRNTTGRNGMNTSSLRAFDFALRNDFVQMSNGNKDMRHWGGMDRTLFGSRAVTFVDNHDTNRAGNHYGQPQVINYKNQAYAYILMREWGVPKVYARDWVEFNMAPSLRRLVQARRFFAYGPGQEMGTGVGDPNTAEVYAYRRAGDPAIPGTGVVLLISGRNTGGVHTRWVNTGRPAGTRFVDLTRNRTEVVTANVHGWAPFTVNLSQGTGFSAWVQEAFSAPANFPRIPANRINRTMYQFFWWDAYPGLWGQLSNPSSTVAAKARDLASVGITGVWLPPAARALHGTNDVGYGVYDFWDLGESISQITLRMTRNVGPGNTLYFSGSVPQLTNWGTGIPGIWTTGNVWQVTINNPGTFQWKTRLGPTGGVGGTWESGANHTQANLHPPFNGGF